MWGAIATGIFATKLINPAGANGLLAGNPKQVLIQLTATAVTVVYSLIATYIIFKLVDIVIGVRVTDNDEAIGID